MFRVKVGGVGEERVHRGQTGVAGGDAVAALRFQGGEESVDQVRVELDRSSSAGAVAVVWAA